MRPIAIAAALALGFVAGSAHAQVEVSAGVTIAEPVEVASFHERLAPYGHWVSISGYGDCWIPNGVRHGWRPYWDGRWVLTEYGWTFVSDDPWGWAAWHYGNWTLVDGYGWVWLPGRTWAPAWVVWRRGGGYAAWAPAQPAFVRVSVWANNSPAWVVVDEHHFTQPIASVSVRASFGATYVGRTEIIARPIAQGGVAINPGPRPEAIATAVGHPVTPIAAHAVIGHGTAAIATAPHAPAAPAAFARANQQRWQQQAAVRERPAQEARAVNKATRPAARHPAKYEKR